MEENVKTPGKSMDYEFFTQEMLPRVKNVTLINFMGGEPTLHPRFNDILSSTLQTIQPFSYLGVFTNGLMPDKTLDLLLETVGPGGSIERHIQFSVLLNWQTMENISERNHQRCREVAEAIPEDGLRFGARQPVEERRRRMFTEAEPRMAGITDGPVMGSGNGWRKMLVVSIAVFVILVLSAVVIALRGG